MRENVQVGFGSSDDGSELLLVFAPHFLESKDSGSLLVNDCAETGLGFNNHVRDTHLAAEGREEDDELDGVDVVRDNDERGLLRLDERNAVVEPVLDEERLFGVFRRLFALSGVLRDGVEAGLLLLLRLGAVSSDKNFSSIL